MKIYRADVTILPKDGVLDIQGKAVENSLHNHGFDAVREVCVGKFVRLAISASDEEDAEKKTTEIVEALLVNDLIESYSFTLESRQ